MGDDLSVDAPKFGAVGDSGRYYKILLSPKLTAAERAMFTARRKDAYETLHPETAHGGNCKESGQLGHSSFSDDQAEKTGQSAQTQRRWQSLPLSFAP